MYSLWREGFGEAGEQGIWDSDGLLGDLVGVESHHPSSVNPAVGDDTMH